MVRGSQRCCAEAGGGGGKAQPLRTKDRSEGGDIYTGLYTSSSFLKGETTRIQVSCIPSKTLFDRQNSGSPIKKA